MKKNLILSLIVMTSLMLMVVGVVSAVVPSVDFITPSEGDYVKGNVFISWENGTYSGVASLMYKEGECDGAGEVKLSDAYTKGNHTWDTDNLNGKYCLMITGTANIFRNITINIDNIAPTAEILETYLLKEDVKSKAVRINITDNIKIKSYEISWGDDKPNKVENSVDVNNLIENIWHKYADNGDYEVKLTVTDYAGNEDYFSDTVTVENVAPYEVTIIAPTVLVTGFPLIFNGDAKDVNADMPITNWLWEIDGDDVSIEQNLTYIFDEAGDYEVKLTATDKDNDSNSTQVIVKVEEAIDLENQEVIAFHKLIYKPKIEEIKGLTDCSLVYASNTGIMVSKDGGNKCKILWTPTNKQNSEDVPTSVIIEATNGTDSAYYSFTVTVYSWMVDLKEGWNLISIPLVHETGDIDDVITQEVREKIERVWSYEYDSSSGTSEWSCSKPSSTGTHKLSNSCGTGIPKITSIEAGRGYWIKVKEGEEATIKGFGQKTSAMPAMIPSIEAPLNSWALLGRYGIVGTTLGQVGPLLKAKALKSLPQIGGRVVYEFDGTSILLTNELNSQQGYLVFVSNPTLTNALYTPINPEYSYN